MSKSASTNGSTARTDLVVENKKNQLMEQSKQLVSIIYYNVWCDLIIQF